jgi:hypothetical protein
MKIDKPAPRRTAPDWNSVKNILTNSLMDTAPSFDLHISRRDGHEFEIQLKRLQDDSKTVEKSLQTPIHIPPALYDLFW